MAAGRPFPLAIVDPDLADRRRLGSDPGTSQASAAPSRDDRSWSRPPVTKPWGNAAALRRRRGTWANPSPRENCCGRLSAGLGLVPDSAPWPASAALPLRPSRSLRILLAEDTPASRLFATEVLQERGHTVQIAEDGREAFELVQQQDFDVVLMDVQMPVMDGFQTTAAIRSLPDPAKSRLPIVAITAHVMQGDEQRCLAAGMDGYLSKPLRSQVLIELVERLAAARPAGSAGIVYPDVAKILASGEA